MSLDTFNIVLAAAGLIAVPAGIGAFARWSVYRHADKVAEQVHEETATALGLRRRIYQNDHSDEPARV